MRVRRGSPIVIPSEPILATDSVTLSRNGCYGTCPSYEVTRCGDGRVRWKGDGFVEAVGERNDQVLGLCGDYSQSVTDSAFSMTDIVVSNARKIIHDYASSSPVWFGNCKRSSTPQHRHTPCGMLIQ